MFLRLHHLPNVTVSLAFVLGISEKENLCSEWYQTRCPGCFCDTIVHWNPSKHTVSFFLRHIYTTSWRFIDFWIEKSRFYLVKLKAFLHYFSHRHFMSEVGIRDVRHLFLPSYS